MYTFKLTLMTLLWSLIVVLMMLATTPATPVASVALSTPLPASISASATIPVTEYPLNAGYINPGVIIRGPDNNVWFTEMISGTTNYAIARITITGTITDFPIPGTPVRMTAGSDDDIWYTRSDVSAVSKMTTAGVVTTYALPSGSTPLGITTGSGNNLWITDYSGNQILQVTTDGNVTGQFSIPTLNSQPAAITLGRDGNLWFTETNFNASKVGRITSTGTFTEFSLPEPYNTFICSTDSMIADANGNLWFCYVEVGTASQLSIAYMTNSGTLVRIGYGGLTLSQFAIGLDRNVWAIGYGRYVPCGVLVRITPFYFVSGVLAGNIPFGPAYYSLGGVASGGDGKIWLTTSSCMSSSVNSILTLNPSTIPSYTTFFPLVGK